MQLFIEKTWLHDIVPMLCGYEECVPSHSFGPAVRSHYLLHYVMDGEGEFIKNGQQYRVNAGDIFVIEPEEVTTYYTGKKHPWVYCWLGFVVEGDAELDFLKEAVIRKPPVRHLFREMKENMVKEDFPERLTVLTGELLIELWKHRAEQRGESDYAGYVKNYLETVYMQPVSIQKIAENLHIDRRYLTALFKEAYLMPPQEYLMKYRLKKAKEFLEKGYRVSEAAAMSGFADLSNFSKRYKLFFGVNPSVEKGNR